MRCVCDRCACAHTWPVVNSRARDGHGRTSCFVMNSDGYFLSILNQSISIRFVCVELCPTKVLKCVLPKLVV